MGLLNDLTLQQIFSRLVAFLIVTAVHGLALAGVARLLGDMKPTYAGRLTLNPAPHLSMPALLMAVLFQLGWIRPMGFSSEGQKLGRLHPAAIALAGLAISALFALALGLAKPIVVATLPRTATFTVLALIEQVQGLTIWFVLLNLLPLPVVTGSAFLLTLWPRLERWLRLNQPYLVGLLVVLIVTGAPEFVLAPAYALISAAIFR